MLYLTPQFDRGDEKIGARSLRNVTQHLAEAEEIGDMLKRIAVALLLVVSLTLQGCVSGVAGLKSYIDTLDGYRFLYPNGWVQVQVAEGPEVVFHDFIDQTDNVSLVINPVAGGKSLQDLGSPTEVGYKLGKNAIAPDGSGRQAELVNAEERERGDKQYYILEYLVQVNGEERHNLASVAVSRGKLFTFNASAPESRWDKVGELLQSSVASFSVD